VRRFVLGVAAWLLAALPAFAGCDATPPVPASLASADSVADYAPVLKLCRKEGETRVAIRTMNLRGDPALLLVDPKTLATQLERAACWTCAETSDEALADTRFIRAVEHAARAPDIAHRGFLSNAGLKHGEGGGAYFTGDLCPSRKPLEREFLASLGAKRTPIALSISGLWLKHHFEDYRWLTGEAASGALGLTWVNHTYTHPYKKGVGDAENFLLTPGVDSDFQIEETERLLIANGGVPSVFFRFPGLVSSSPLMKAVAAHHLISLGADAWLALGETPHDGSIILVHPNGNEPQGLKIFSRAAADGRLPTPLKPLDEAPE
jgi:hypothetical protein